MIKRVRQQKGDPNILTKKTEFFIGNVKFVT